MDVKHHDRKKDVSDLARVNVVGWGWRSRRVVVVGGGGGVGGVVIIGTTFVASSVSRNATTRQRRMVWNSLLSELSVSA